MITQNLSKTNVGIVLSNNVIDNVFKKKNTSIINSYKYTNLSNLPIYVTDNNYAYGIIELSNPEKISLEEFVLKKDKHNLTTEQVKKWWPNKQVLFSYDIKNIFKTFMSPVKIKNNKGVIGNFILKDFDLDEEVILTQEEIDKCYNVLQDVSEDNKHVSINIENSAKSFTYHNFESIYDAVEHMFFNGSSFIVEQDYPGICCTLIKHGEKSTLYSDKKKDISSLFPKVMEKVKNISEKDYAIDCRLCIQHKNKDFLKEIIEKNEKYKEDDIKLYVVDCLYYNNDTVTSDYRDRKQILQTFLYNDKVYETPYLYVENLTDVVHGYNIMKMVNDNVVVVNNSENKKYTISEELSESSITNHDFFSKESGPMMYYLGFISCDGHVDNSTNRVEIHIAKEDSEIIKNLQKLLGDTRDISNGFLKFKSVEMVKDLTKYDITKLKPQRRTFNKIPEKYKWDFIRGSFDADGTISKEKLQFDSGNREMVKWMYEQLKKVGGEDVKYYEYDSTSKCTVYEKAVSIVHSKIYSGSGPSLQRKKNYLHNKSEMSEETTTSDIGKVQGVKIKKKILKPAQLLQEHKKDNLCVQLKMSEDKFYVESFINHELSEHYCFDDNKKKAEKVFEEIKNE
jgi:hypothetical protein